MEINYLNAQEVLWHRWEAMKIKIKREGEQKKFVETDLLYRNREKFHEK